MKKQSAIAVLALILNSRGSSPADQRRDGHWTAIAGVPLDLLEQRGIYLTLLVQAEGLLSEARAHELGNGRFGGRAVKEVVLANMRNNYGPGAGPAYRYDGPVWVVSLDTTGYTTYAGDRLATADSILLFFNARTGEFLSGTQLNRVIEG